MHSKLRLIIISALFILLLLGSNFYLEKSFNAHDFNNQYAPITQPAASTQKVIAGQKQAINQTPANLVVSDPEDFGIKVVRNHKEGPRNQLETDMYVQSILEKINLAVSPGGQTVLHKMKTSREEYKQQLQELDAHVLKIEENLIINPEDTRLQQRLQNLYKARSLAKFYEHQIITTSPPIENTNSR